MSSSLEAAIDDDRIVRLISQDNDSFEVAFGAIKISGLILTLINEEQRDAGTHEIPLVNVKSSILAKVLEFVQHYREEPLTDIEKPLPSNKMVDFVQPFYAQFVEVEQEVLFELILAAEKMDIKPLLDLTCASVASLIKGKTPEEIRKTFNIVNDFTPEEEAQVREENKWCEEA